eukprot:4202412-Pleurochrysis_carterae.AAC.1
MATTSCEVTSRNPQQLCWKVRVGQEGRLYDYLLRRILSTRLAWNPLLPIASVEAPATANSRGSAHRTVYCLHSAVHWQTYMVISNCQYHTIPYCSNAAEALPTYLTSYREFGGDTMAAAELVSEEGVNRSAQPCEVCGCTEFEKNVAEGSLACVECGTLVRGYREEAAETCGSLFQSRREFQYGGKRDYERMKREQRRRRLRRPTLEETLGAFQALLQDLLPSLAALTGGGLESLARAVFAIWFQCAPMIAAAPVTPQIAAVEARLADPNEDVDEAKAAARASAEAGSSGTATAQQRSDVPPKFEFDIDRPQIMASPYHIWGEKPSQGQLLNAFQALSILLLACLQVVDRTACNDHACLGLMQAWRASSTIRRALHVAR